MAVQAQVMVRCDAPSCERLLEDHDGRSVFPTIEVAMDVADEQNWLVTHSQRDGRGEQRWFCPEHWHRQFGARMPYWGVKRRRYR